VLREFEEQSVFGYIPNPAAAATNARMIEFDFERHLDPGLLAAIDGRRLGYLMHVNGSTGEMCFDEMKSRPDRRGLPSPASG